MLQKEVDTNATKEAFEGYVGTMVMKDYRGVSVLSAYTPLNLNFMNWALLVEMDEAEAFASIYSVELKLTVIASIIGFIALSYLYLEYKKEKKHAVYEEAEDSESEDSKLAEYEIEFTNELLHQFKAACENIPEFQELYKKPTKRSLYLAKRYARYNEVHLEYTVKEYAFLKDFEGFMDTLPDNTSIDINCLKMMFEHTKNVLNKEPSSKIFLIL